MTRQYRPRVPAQYHEIIQSAIERIGWEGIISQLHSVSTSKISYNQTSAGASLESKGRITSLEELIAQSNTDLSSWEIERHVVNKWEVGGKDKDGNITIEPLWQIKAWLKKKPFVFDIAQWEHSFMENMKAYAPKYDRIKYTIPKVPHALEIFVSDHHFGKHVWRGETNFDYDLKIADRTYDDAVDSILSDAAGFMFDEIVYMVGSDLQHIDNKNNTTTNGTPQDTDSRWQKIWDTAFFATVRNIEKCSLLAKVTVKVIPGNHDWENSYKMGFALAAWFRNSPNVVIDNSPSPRKYWRYGKVLLMLTHGDKGKTNDYFKVVANECREDWAEAKYVEVHTGDKHGLKVTEDKGVRIRIIPALCPPDSWHHQNMYIGNIMSTEAFVWHREQGLKATFNYNV